MSKKTSNLFSEKELVEIGLHPDLNLVKDSQGLAGVHTSEKKQKSLLDGFGFVEVALFSVILLLFFLVAFSAWRYFGLGEKILGNTTQVAVVELTSTPILGDAGVLASEPTAMPTQPGGDGDETSIGRIEIFLINDLEVFVNEPISLSINLFDQANNPIKESSEIRIFVSSRSSGQVGFDGISAPIHTVSISDGSQFIYTPGNLGGIEKIRAELVSNPTVSDEKIFDVKFRPPDSILIKPIEPNKTLYPGSEGIKFEVAFRHLDSIVPINTLLHLEPMLENEVVPENFFIGLEEPVKIEDGIGKFTLGVDPNNLILRELSLSIDKNPESSASEFSDLPLINSETLIIKPLQMLSELDLQLDSQCKIINNTAIYLNGNIRPSNNILSLEQGSLVFCDQPLPQDLDYVQVFSIILLHDSDNSVLTEGADEDSNFIWEITTNMDSEFKGNYHRQSIFNLNNVPEPILPPTQAHGGDEGTDPLYPYEVILLSEIPDRGLKLIAINGYVNKADIEEQN